MNTVQTKLLARLESNGYKGAVVSIEHCKDLQQEVTDLHTSGLLEKEFYKGSLSGFIYDYANKLPGAASIIITAAPQPITKLRFPWRGKNREIVIPPTYIWAESDQRVLEILQHELSLANHSVLRARLPLKMLAVHSGLSKYGRNNISYVEGMGSFHRLVAWVTDMPCEDHWQEVKRMPSCDTCRVCLQSCPTRCIDEERFLIHAENCLTHLNEYGGEFPAWVNGSWHNAWVGCMNCQMTCPQNKDCVKTVEMEDVFTEEEVSLILNAVELEMLPEKIQNTLRKLNLVDYYGDQVLSRNLHVLINK